jgi:hypothetical protein
MNNVSAIASAVIAIVLFAPAAIAQSHLNVPASRHVILNSEVDDGTCCSSGACFRFIHFPTQLLPNGETRPFSIPRDKTLVITDVEWNWQNTDNNFPNQAQLLRLFLGPNSIPDVAKSNALTDGNSFAGAAIALTSGFTVASGTPICGFFGFGTSPFLGFATLGGYLDDDKQR